MRMIEVLKITLIVIFALSLFIGFIAGRKAAEEPPAEPSTTAPEPEIKEYVIYDVPLSKELQIYTQGVCEQYGIDYLLVLALMWRESDFDITAISPTGCYGIMQLNSRYYPDAKKLDTKYIIRAGIALLSNYTMQYGNTEMALIAYHNGATGAHRLFCKGIYSTEYSRSVIDYVEKLNIHERIYEEV